MTRALGGTGRGKLVGTGLGALLAFAAMGSTVAPADEPSTRGPYVVASVSADDFSSAGFRARPSVPSELTAEALRLTASKRNGITASDAVAVGDKAARLRPASVAGSKFPRLPQRWRYARNEFSALIERYAAENGVPAELAHAIIEIESQFRPQVRGRAGEVGLMQIKPATARLMGFRGASGALFDPETNIKFGMRYLAKARRLGGENGVCGTILKYNAGHGARRMNPVSRRYCEKVKAVFARNEERWRIDDAQIYAFLDRPVPLPRTRLGAR